MYKEIFTRGKLVVGIAAGCFYSTSAGGLRCYRNPKNKITAVPAKEEEIWGATFKVQSYSFPVKNFPAYTLL